MVLRLPSAQAVCSHLAFICYEKLNANKGKTTISSSDWHFKLSLFSLTEHLVKLDITMS